MALQRRRRKYKFEDRTNKEPSLRFQERAELRERNIFSPRRTGSLSRFTHTIAGRAKNEDCKLSQSYYAKFKGIRKYDEMHAFYDNGSCDTNVIDKQTYNELYKSGQKEPSWDELGN